MSLEVNSLEPATAEKHHLVLVVSFDSDVQLLKPSDININVSKQLK